MSSLYAGIPRVRSVSSAEARELVDGLRCVVLSTCMECGAKYELDYQPLFYERGAWRCVHCPKEV